MRASPIQARSSVFAVEAVDGYPVAIDEAAAASPCHAFLRAGWFAASGKAASTVVATRADGAVIAAVPLARAGRLPVRAVPGSYWPYRSVPIAADATEAELGAVLASEAFRRAGGTAWRAGPVYDDDPGLGVLLPAARGAGWTVLSRTLGTSFVLDLAAVQADGAWPRGSTLKKNRYFEKQLAVEGVLEWRFVRGSEWSGEVLDILASIEARSWVASDTDRSGAKFLDPASRRYWETACADSVIAAMLGAAILLVGERPVAFSFDLDAGTTKHIIANAYDPDFARHSPGRLLAYRNLAEAAARGVRRVDWGSGDDGYKGRIGAVPGPRILDLLMVRNSLLAAVLRPVWARLGTAK